MKFVALFIGLTFFISCSDQPDTKADQPMAEVENSEDAEDMYFGERIDKSDAIGVSALSVKLETKDTIHAKVISTINNTCSKKGCWMTVELSEGREMMVRFKDYGFFVPQEGVEGKTTVFEGFAYTDSVSVEDLKHYAYDAGEDSTAIAAITKPEVALAFEASGVIIKN